MTINLPAEAQTIIDTLEADGYEAYAVGGCVRDYLMGAEPADWDICTPALPEETMRVFEGHRIIQTGLKHGTVTLVLNDTPFEVTTYRVDGKYTDNRRPDKVKFVDVLKRDIARRDFTINAIAYNPKTGLVDYYGGQKDLTDRKIKSVGNPDKRFGEDALRIMRALRFASAFGFEVEERTSDSIHRSKHLLRNIAPERIAAELNKLLLGRGADDVLRLYLDVLSVIIPELKECNILSAAPRDATLRLAVLLRHIGAEAARDVLARLKYDKNTADTVYQLVLYYDADIEPSQKSVRRWMNRIGEERLRQLVRIKNARDIPPLIDEIAGEGLCFSLKDLAVNGKDLISAGAAEGVMVGKALNRLLDMVIDGDVENDKEILLRSAKMFINC